MGVTREGVQVLVHGGAGSEPDEPEPRQTVLDEAAAMGCEAATPLDAVETAVRVLESDSRFNAGVGGARQADGVVRTDAGIMTGDRAVGAVCSMPGVEHAVSVARVVLEATPHVLVSGDHAVALATAADIPVDTDLTTEHTQQRWADTDPPPDDVHEQLAWVREHFGASTDTRSRPLERGSDHDTVGAVARDGRDFAAATSTGGRWYAFPGRVGDVPQVGSGFYASLSGAASATGAGEDIARVTLSRRAVQYLEDGLGAETAAEHAIEEFETHTESTAGVILVDADGIGAAFNTDSMQTSAIME